MEGPLDSWVTWEPAADEEAIDALARLADQAPEFFAGATLVSVRSAKLPFYAAHRLIDLQFERDHGPERAFALHAPGHIFWLDGTSAPVHEANEREALVLSDATVVDYVRFFLFFVRGEDGAFVLIDAESDLGGADVGVGTAEHDGGAADGDHSELGGRIERVRSRIRPLTVRTIDEEGRWVLDALVAFADTLFLATFAVEPSGPVEMLSDDPVESLEGVSVVSYPTLALVPDPTQSLVAGGTVDAAAEVPRDRDVTEAIVAVLLEDALRERGADSESSMLLRHFNVETDAGKPLDRLTRLVAGSVPVIIVESDLPFVEDFVAGLVDGPSQVVTGGAIGRASAVSGDELRCFVDLDNRATKVHLISFHAYRGLYDAERTAHELALGDAAVVIGCYRSHHVPEPLRRIADLVLTFPRIDRRRFARIFERVFSVKPTPGWDASGADWTRYLVPADFHAPRRLNLRADQAIRFLKERVEDRLREVSPDIGPGLKELHGLGEARQVCEDLIADIRAAQAGRIPWVAVDRGVLLVGAPGTGKTTLARAVARECGVKFIVASAARWQSAGHLGDHLRAMRDDFAEARRYAPAILFIDEIDGIGSREQIVGDHNAVYQTEVINALLEQIQGINTGEDPVFVIGATNYPERVDPALRRAGRLDQVVEVPLPNIAGLEKIFDYYLKPHRTEKEVARSVDTRSLAELSFGLTGADVEFFVRGAARRARRARRKITQEDLLAEVTRLPRRPDSVPRRSSEELRRTAVHEAGHAVARLLSSTEGKDITFVTIVPRLDGTLGFVATVPLDGYVLTRRTMLERLETFLAGRAAEEIVFGADEVGAGAGGPSRESDLAVATQLAELYVCRTGLGGDGSLHWTETPTPAQVKQVNAMLGKAYDDIVARLEEHRALLDEIVDILVQKQELSGGELRGLLARAEDTASTVR